MIFLTGNSTLSVPPHSKALLNPVVVVCSPPQCAISVVPLPEPVGSAVVVVSSPPQCAIRAVHPPDPVVSAFCIVLIYSLFHLITK